MTVVAYRLWQGSLYVGVGTVLVLIAWLVVRPRRRRLDPGEAEPEEIWQPARARVVSARVLKVLAIVGVVLSAYDLLLARAAVTALVRGVGTSGSAELSATVVRSGPGAITTYVVQVNTGPPGSPEASSTSVGLLDDHVLGLSTAEVRAWCSGQRLPAHYLRSHPRIFTVDRPPTGCATTPG